MRLALQYRTAPYRIGAHRTGLTVLTAYLHALSTVRGPNLDGTSRVLQRYRTVPLLTFYWLLLYMYVCTCQYLVLQKSEEHNAFVENDLHLLLRMLEKDTVCIYTCIYMYMYIQSVFTNYPFHSFFEHLINEEGEIFRRAVIEVHKMLKILQIYTCTVYTRT